MTNANDHYESKTVTQKLTIALQ